jgi:hypothetical protein
MAATQTHSWPTIALAWRQRVAAFWLVAWPSWILSFASVAVVTSGWSVADLVAHSGAMSAIANVVFLAVQAFLVRRMIRKKYRSFRLVVVRTDGSTTSTLSLRDVLHVWVKIIWPQVAFLVAVWIVLMWQGSDITEETTRAISTLSLWGRLLVVGPFGVYCAVPADYRTFRLEAVGQRFV